MTCSRGRAGRPIQIGTEMLAALGLMTRLLDCIALGADRLEQRCQPAPLARCPILRSLRVREQIEDYPAFLVRTECEIARGRRPCAAWACAVRPCRSRSTASRSVCGLAHQHPACLECDQADRPHGLARQVEPSSAPRFRLPIRPRRSRHSARARLASADSGHAGCRGRETGRLSVSNSRYTVGRGRCVSLRSSTTDGEPAAVHRHQQRQGRAPASARCRPRGFALACAIFDDPGQPIVHSADIQSSALAVARSQALASRQNRREEPICPGSMLITTKPGGCR